MNLPGTIIHGTPEDVPVVFRSILTSGLVLIFGPPGVGKTSFVRYVMEKSGGERLFSSLEGGIETYAFSAGQYGPIDLLFPVPTEQGVKTVPLEIVQKAIDSAKKKLTVLVIDDIHTAPPDVQPHLLAVTGLEREIAGTRIPDTFRVVATANPPGPEQQVGLIAQLVDRAAVYRLIPDPVMWSRDFAANWGDPYGWPRSVPQGLEIFNVETWREWREVVSAFIASSGDAYLLYTDKYAPNELIASPRSWEMTTCRLTLEFSPRELSASNANVAGSLLKRAEQTASAYLPPSVVNRFLAFLRVWQRIPDVEKLLADPQEFLQNTRDRMVLSVASLLVSRAMERAAQTDKKKFLNQFVGWRKYVTLLEDKEAGNILIMVASSWVVPAARKYRDVLNSTIEIGGKRGTVVSFVPHLVQELIYRVYAEDGQ